MRPTAYLERSVILFTLASAVSTSGCLPSKGNLGEYTGGEAGTSETDASDSDSDGGTTATTTASSTTASSSTESSSTGDDIDVMPFDPGCVAPANPSPQQLQSFTFDPPLQDGEFAATCQVLDVEPHPNQASVGLDCGDQLVQFGLIVAEPLGTLIAPGDTLVLDYRATLSFAMDEWFTLRRPDPDATLVLAGMAAERLSPPGAAEFFAPLSLTAQEGLCPVPTNCDDFGEKIAVEFDYDGDAVQVFEMYDAQLGDLPRYDVSLHTARKTHPKQSLGDGQFCEIFDAPPYFFDSLIRLVPEG